MMSFLVLCTGNSARSIMGEALLRERGAGRVTAQSAGSKPVGAPNPFALAQLRSAGHDIADFRSKSWSEFEDGIGPDIDVVLTVCDSAAAEPCPYWPGAPVTAHWGLSDPAAATGTDTDIARAFADAYAILDHRVGLLMAYPFETLSKPDLRSLLGKIGTALPTDI